MTNRLTKIELNYRYNIQTYQCYVFCSYKKSIRNNIKEQRPRMDNKPDRLHLKKTDDMMFKCNSAWTISMESKWYVIPIQVDRDSIINSQQRKEK